MQNRIKDLARFLSDNYDKFFPASVPICCGKPKKDGSNCGGSQEDAAVAGDNDENEVQEGGIAQQQA